jgi:DNA-directed RNA polymerase specialized sigma24 family protein
MDFRESWTDNGRIAEPLPDSWRAKRMADEAPVTQLLREFKAGKRDVADVIVGYFWDSARRAAHKHLSARLRRLQIQSDIANAALRSALSFLEKPKSVITSRDSFEGLVLTIVEKHAKDAGRRATAGKRDMRRQTGLPEWDVLKGNEELADQLVVAKELGERIEKLLMQDPDDETQAITRMGIISHLEPKAIKDALASSRRAGGAPALRTIQRDLKDAKDRLAEALREEYGNLRAPKKKAAKKKAMPSTRGTKTASKKTTKKAWSKGS